MTRPTYRRPVEHSYATTYLPERPYAAQPLAHQPGWAWPTPGGYLQVEYPEPVDPTIQKYVINPWEIWYPGLYHPYGALTGVRSKDATLLQSLQRPAREPDVFDLDQREWKRKRGSMALQQARHPLFFTDVEADVLAALGFDAEDIEEQLTSGDSFGAEEAADAAQKLADVASSVARKVQPVVDTTQSAIRQVAPIFRRKGARRRPAPSAYDLAPAPVDQAALVNTAASSGALGATIWIGTILAGVGVGYALGRRTR